MYYIINRRFLEICFPLIFLAGNVLSIFEMCPIRNREREAEFDGQFGVLELKQWLENVNRSPLACGEEWKEGGKQLVNVGKCGGKGKSDYYKFNGDLDEGGMFDGDGRLEVVDEYVRRKKVCIKVGLGVRAVEGIWRKGRLEGKVKVEMKGGSWLEGTAFGGVLNGEVRVIKNKLVLLVKFLKGEPSGPGWLFLNSGYLFVRFIEGGKLESNMAWIDKQEDLSVAHVGVYNGRDGIMDVKKSAKTSNLLEKGCIPFLNLNSSKLAQNGMEGIRIDIPQMVSWIKNRLHVGPTQVLAFNRVVKTGSGAIKQLLNFLSEHNKFEIDFGAHEVEHFQDPDWQQQEMAERLAGYPTAVAWIQHYSVMDLRKFGLPQPTWFVMVRHPVERVISWFYYSRADFYQNQRKHLFPHLPPPDQSFLEKDFEDCVLSGDPECQFSSQPLDRYWGHKRQMMLLCGHQEVCTNLNSRTALEIAKDNVDNLYSVVGVLEDWDITLEVVEKVIPKFFKGVVHMNNVKGDEISGRNFNAQKKAVSQKVRDIIAANLTLEIEFYNYCRSKLHEVYAELFSGN